jgi:hypothetical protein
VVLSAIFVLGAHDHRPATEFAMDLALTRRPAMYGDNEPHPPRGAQPEPMLQFFEYGHLPEELQLVSKNFCDLAYALVLSLPRNPERTVALRKLLEAKDCAVRALLYRDPAAS